MPETRAEDDRCDHEPCITIGAPSSVDGADVHDLIASCPPLDQNSLYANLIQCTHFADTCAIARRDGKTVGWVSGHIPPRQPDVFFLWQIAVDASTRGQKLPERLVASILSRPTSRDVRYINTTITPGNRASWKMFERLARWLSAPMRTQDFFEREGHFRGRHDSETLVIIGPFDPGSVAA